MRSAEVGLLAPPALQAKGRAGRDKARISSIRGAAARATPMHHSRRTPGSQAGRIE